MADDSTQTGDAEIARLRKIAARQMPDINQLQRKYDQAYSRLIGLLAEGSDAVDARRKASTAERDLTEAQDMARYISDARRTVHDHDTQAERAEAARQASTALEAAAATLDEAAKLADEAKAKALEGIKAVQAGASQLPQGNATANGQLVNAYQDARKPNGSPLVGDAGRLASLAETARNLKGEADAVGQ